MRNVPLASLPKRWVLASAVLIGAAAFSVGSAGGQEEPASDESQVVDPMNDSSPGEVPLVESLGEGGPPGQFPTMICASGYVSSAEISIGGPGTASSPEEAMRRLLTTGVGRGLADVVEVRIGATTDQLAEIGLFNASGQLVGSATALHDGGWSVVSIDHCETGPDQ